MGKRVSSPAARLVGAIETFDRDLGPLTLEQDATGFNRLVFSETAITWECLSTNGRMRFMYWRSPFMVTR